MTVRAVLFDLYDTLVHVDTKALSRKFATCADLVGVDVENFRAGWAAVAEESNLGRFATIEARVEAVLTRLGAAFSPSIVSVLADVERAFLRAHVHAFADVRATLGVLRAEGFRLAIVTNASSSARLVLAQRGLEPLVDAVVLSSDVHHVKPTAAIYHHALVRVGVTAAAASFVGDGNDRELDGAKAVGLHTVLVQRDYERYGARVMSSPVAADAVVRAVAEVPLIVRQFHRVG